MQVLLALFTLIGVAYATTAYDCGAQTLNLTTISLLEMEECDQPKVDVKNKTVNIQLLQRVDYHAAKVL